jgi:hypothetical protein
MSRATPAGEKAGERDTPTVAELGDRFLVEHMEPRRKVGTAASYRYVLDRIVKPTLGAAKADKVTRAESARLHGKLQATPSQANRMLAVVRSGRPGSAIGGSGDSRCAR